MTGTDIERRLADLRRLDEARLTAAQAAGPAVDTGRAWRELQRRRYRSRAVRRQARIAGTAALTATAVAAALVIPAIGAGPGRPGPDHPSRAAGRGPVPVFARAVVSRIPLTGSGQVVTVGSYAWTMRDIDVRGRYQLDQIDLRSNTVTRRVNLGLDLRGSLTAGGGSVWVTTRYGQAGGQILRLDPATGRTIGRLHLAAGPCSAVAYSAGRLWTWCATSAHANEVLLVSAATGNTLWKAGPVPRSIDSVAFTPTGAWYVTGAGLTGLIRDGGGVRKVTVRDPSYPVSLGLSASMVYAAGYLWVLTNDESVAKIDPATGKVVRVYTYQTYDPGYGLGLSAMVVSGGSLWFLDDGSVNVRAKPRSGVLRVSEATGRRLGFVPVGGPHPCGEPCVALYATPGALWMPTSNHLVRIAPSVVPAVRPARRSGN